MSVGKTNATLAGLPFHTVVSPAQPSRPKDCTVWIKSAGTIARIRFAEAWVSGVNGEAVILYRPVNSEAEVSGSCIPIAERRQNGIMHSITVVLTAAQQFSDDIRKSVDAFVFRDGSWVQFSWARQMLFDGGDQKASTTGGWGRTISGAAVTYNLGTDRNVRGAVGAAIALNGFGGSRNECSVFVTAKPIATNGLKTLKIAVSEITNGNDGCILEFGFCSGGTDLQKTHTVFCSIRGHSAGTVSLDISGITEGYVYLAGSYTGSSYSECKAVISQVWME